MHRSSLDHAASIANRSAPLVYTRVASPLIADTGLGIGGKYGDEGNVAQTKPGPPKRRANDGDDNNNHDGGSRTRTRDQEEMRRVVAFFKQIDRMGWEDKLIYVLQIAQPFGDRKGGFGSPAFPVTDVPDTHTARRRILEAANNIVVLWAPGDLAQRQQRDMLAVQEWRDILSHPELYRRLFGEWIGHVYVDREAVEDIAEQAEDASRSGSAEVHPPPSWNRTDAMRGTQIASTGLYAHGPPERFGHRVELVPADTSDLAAQYHKDVQDAYAQDRQEQQSVWSDNEEDQEGSETEAFDSGRGSDFEPEFVVRMRDLGWYLAGFLGSVLVWTHLAHTQIQRLGALDPDTPADAGFDLQKLLRHPQRVLDRDLFATWATLKRYLTLCRCDVLLPIPDVIRVPQEWCMAMAALNRGEKPHDKVIWRGLSGDERRHGLSTPPKDVALSEWLTTGAERPRVQAYLERVLEHRRQHQEAASAAVENAVVASREPTAHWDALTLYLQEMQDSHQARVYTHLHMGMLRMRRMPLTERYVPMPEPPHPLPALYMPWTVLSATNDARPGFYRERVVRLASVGVLHLAWVALPCLETGLAIETWGATWNQTQRQERRDRARLTPTQVRKQLRSAVLAGQSVPFYDDPPIKRFIGRPLMVLDERGPIGAGYRLYDAADAMRPGFDRTEMDWWLRIDLMRAVERLGLEGPLPDELGRWEDSGIELPSLLERSVPDLDRHLHTLWLAPLPAPPDAQTMRQLMRHHTWGHHLGSPFSLQEERARWAMWRQAAGRAGRRAWVPQRIAPWPVSFAVDGANLRQEMDLTPLAEAPIVRDIRLQRVAVPDPRWLHNMLVMPASVETSGNQDLDLTLTEWKRAVQDSGLPLMSLTPMARRTLVSLSFDRVDYTAPHARHIPHERTAALLFPGIPFATRPSDVVKSAFRHYPNLTLVSLRDNQLTDLPRGLLDLVLTAAWKQPPSAAPKGGRSSGPSYHAFYWDLSENQIRDLSPSTLEALAWTVLYTISAATSPEQYRRRARMRVNLWGNPIAQQPGVRIERRVVKDPQSGLVSRMEERVSWFHYIRPRIAFLGAGKPGDLSKRLPGAVVVPDLDVLANHIASAFVLVHPTVFQRDMLQRRRLFDQQRYRWMI